MALSTVAAVIGQAQAETASSWELTPVILAFVLPIVGLAVTLMRYQHVDSTKTREWTAELIERTSRETREWTAELIERTNRETREWTAVQFDLLRTAIGAIGDRLDDFSGRLDDFSDRLDDLSASLNDARERLARIEGRLDATHPQPDGNDGEDSRDAA